eukprot:TRINITY_DN3869_c0_g1_i1.p1 TRINITY_DN3869_c0_g1~~TRINITY_DN3869_c0_g1_i1.p1  ORF type:complete len:811 (+),score=175.91 TRINITY_DN3869_c0_g1_i1:401-2833(+)
MAGIPRWSLDTYLERFVKKGYTVTVAEQVLDDDGKVLGREVARVVTPGTLVEDSLLQPRQSNFLCAIHQTDSQQQVGLAWMDLSTGEFYTTSTSLTSLPAELSRLSPREVLTVKDSALNLKFLPADVHVSTHPAHAFTVKTARALIADTWNDPAVSDQMSIEELVASGGLLNYVNYTQKAQLTHFARPARFETNTVMQIDPASRRNLEVAKTLTGDVRGSLLWVMDKTCFAPGGRLLASRLSAPLTDVFRIQSRLDCVEFFVQNIAVCDQVRLVLRHCQDMERSVQRLGMNRGGPRDLMSIGSTLKQVAALVKLLHKSQHSLPEAVVAQLQELTVDSSAEQEICNAIIAEPPLSISDGGFIKSGYDPELDRQRVLRDQRSKLLVAMQDRYAQQTKASSLKIKQNNLIGYFLEVKATQSKLLSSDMFNQVQELAGVVRFKTVELGELEAQFNQAASVVRIREIVLYQQVVQHVLSHASALLTATQSLAAIDVAAALATLAVERKYTRPTLTAGMDFDVQAGRHPIVEVMQVDNTFVTNACDLAPDKKLWLVTGPNMGGKSTFLRQNALISIMAQMGSFVPASKATIGIVDQLFCRVGASDDLSHHLSTFMVEMVETANILKQASSRSLVIMDEIGRGTSTMDGLAIAWAVMEHLHHVIKARVLFATHFHELAQLQDQFASMHCATMDVIETNAEIAFSHRVIDGIAQHSYGVPCARLAGVPEAVTTRAAELLTTLRSGPDAEQRARLMNSNSSSRTIPSPPQPQQQQKLTHIARYLKLKPEDVRVSDVSALLKEYQTLAALCAQSVIVKEL